MMAAIAKWRDDQSGNLVTAGTSTAYTLTTNQVYTALTDGISVTARMDEASGAAPTLNVDSLGAKAIASAYGVAIPTGSLKSGGVYTFTYDATDDKWIVHGDVGRSIPAGTQMLVYANTAPVGWVTIDISYDNVAVRCVAGSALGGGTGGVTIGSTVYTDVFKARTDVAAHTHTYSGTTSTESALHTHGIQTYSRTGSGSGYPGYDGSGNAISSIDATDTQSALHTHTYSGTTTSTGSGMDFNVRTLSFLACEKSAY